MSVNVHSDTTVLTCCLGANNCFFSSCLNLIRWSSRSSWWAGSTRREWPDRRPRLPWSRRTPRLWITATRSVNWSCTVRFIHRLCCYSTNTSKEPSYQVLKSVSSQNHKTQHKNTQDEEQMRDSSSQTDRQACSTCHTYSIWYCRNINRIAIWSDIMTILTKVHIIWYEINL